MSRFGSTCLGHMRAVKSRNAIGGVRKLYSIGAPFKSVGMNGIGLKYGLGPPLMVAGGVVGVIATGLNKSASEHNGISGIRSKRWIHLDSPEKGSVWSRLGITTTTTTSSDDKNSQDPEGKSGDQAPPPQTKVIEQPSSATEKDQEPKREEETSSSWIQPLTSTVATATSSATSSVSDLSSTIVDYVVPDWFKLLPEYWSKLQRELSLAPGSVADEIWKDAADPSVHPEIAWEASVRVSDDLCEEEKRFLERRRVFTKKGLARYLGVKEEEVDERDVPVIAMCGSGGGLRALVAGAASYLAAEEDGLWDCVTYTAGVSGSCWLQALYYSEIGRGDHKRLIRHLRNRLGVHIAFPPDALKLLASAPTNKLLLAGIVEKALGYQKKAEFGLVDVYGVLLAARLLVPKGELGVDERDFKLSGQRRFVDGGGWPLPVYTAVRHEIPGEPDPERQGKQGKGKDEAWFQWFEFTPYEFWCEEFHAGIPTWALGRPFDHGRSVPNPETGLSLPELRLPSLLGIWGSAFCATLSHYYKEIQPAVRSLAGFSGLDQLISTRDDDLSKLHPIDPAAVPNFAVGLEDFLPPEVPDSVVKGEDLKLMDAGMSNNLPIYPLLRPGRDVDVLIAFDASADVKTDNWLKVADGYARQRGIKGWPMGAGWPPEEETEEQIERDLERAQAQSEEEAEEKVERAEEREEAEAKKAKAKGKKSKDLSYCNIWVGTTAERTPDSSSSSADDSEPTLSKLVEEDWELMEPDAGITVIYFPFLSNPAVDDGKVDPKTSPYLSTWNFVYGKQEVDGVVGLARRNYQEGSERVRRVVRAVWERKRKIREEREEGERRRREEWLKGGRKGNSSGDHFS